MRSQMDQDLFQVSGKTAQSRSYPEREAEQVRREKRVSLMAPLVEDLLDIAVKTSP
jgi:hypothetical protein